MRYQKQHIRMANTCSHCTIPAQIPTAFLDRFSKVLNSNIPCSFLHINGPGFSWHMSLYSTLQRNRPYPKTCTMFKFSNPVTGQPPLGFCNRKKTPPSVYMCRRTKSKYRHKNHFILYQPEAKHKSFNHVSLTDIFIELKQTWLVQFHTFHCPWKHLSASGMKQLQS